MSRPSLAPERCPCSCCLQPDHPRTWGHRIPLSIAFQIWIPLSCLDLNRSRKEIGSPSSGRIDRLNPSLTAAVGTCPSARWLSLGLELSEQADRLARHEADYQVLEAWNAKQLDLAVDQLDENWDKYDAMAERLGY